MSQIQLEEQVLPPRIELPALEKKIFEKKFSWYVF